MKKKISSYLDGALLICWPVFRMRISLSVALVALAFLVGMPFGYDTAAALFMFLLEMHKYIHRSIGLFGVEIAVDPKE